VKPSAQPFLQAMEQAVICRHRTDGCNADGIESQRPSFSFNALSKGHGE
jgi:hypothetical protein